MAIVRSILPDNQISGILQAVRVYAKEFIPVDRALGEQRLCWIDLLEPGYTIGFGERSRAGSPMHGCRFLQAYSSWGDDTRQAKRLTSRCVAQSP